VYELDEPGDREIGQHGAENHSASPYHSCGRSEYQRCSEVEMKA
jgi:hypothetical protein